MVDSVFDTIPHQQDELNLVSTCVNYSDYLEDTLRYNHTTFGKIYIITCPSDLDTIAVCEKYTNVYCIVTDLFHKNGSVFNKGRAINYWLTRIQKKGWLVIGDSDCVFPKTIIEDIRNINKNNLYSYPRHIAKNKQHLSDIIYNKVDPLFLPNRNAKKILGYCQLFNLESHKGSHVQYPTYSRDASKSDIVFSSNWSSRNRIVLNNSYVIHLGEISTNWRGRRTKKWT